MAENFQAQLAALTAENKQLREELKERSSRASGNLRKKKRMCGIPTVRYQYSKYNNIRLFGIFPTIEKINYPCLL